MPTAQSLERLKRLVRYLVTVTRLVFHFPWQSPTDNLDTMVDTDFAGCRVSRRSTSGGVALRGRHCIRHLSQTQSTITLSSGDAELQGICRGATQAMSQRSVAADLCITLQIHVRQTPQLL